MPTPVKTRFSDAEDILILREVKVRLPFTAKRGSVMLAWNAVADAVSTNHDFARPGFDDKRALSRFTLLMEGHRANNDVSARASGIDEDHDEKTQLLDELLAVYEDSKAQDKARLVAAQQEADRIENMGATIREEALQSLGKRKAGPTDADGSSASGGGGGSVVMKMMKMMQDDSAADLKFRQHQYETDRKEREAVRAIEYEERQCEREMYRDQMRMQHDTLVAILQSKNNAI
ncbi:hypothetical protein DYB35_013831 [Aphanomyces astaci]|uniref:Uncharacterized protein n=1 Tax=Aphanomyces astaci TaxID=112090 RepID=A0A418CUM6_APHAT|nr:hypothetical protein DYB35_013831 [Aphanomyces astaci]